MDNWQNASNAPMVDVVKKLLGDVMTNNTQYLNDEIGREKWIEIGLAIDDKLAVAGLRLTVRPWRSDGR